jgi:hypothetical protein
MPELDIRPYGNPWVSTVFSPKPRRMSYMVIGHPTLGMGLCLERKGFEAALF